MESPKSTDKGQYFLIYLFPKNIISHHHRKSGQDSYASRMDAVQYYHKKVAITQSIEPCPSSVDDHISTGIAGQWQRNKFSWEETAGGDLASTERGIQQQVTKNWIMLKIREDKFVNSPSQLKIQPNKSWRIKYVRNKIFREWHCLLKSPNFCS